MSDDAVMRLRALCDDLRVVLASLDAAERRAARATEALRFYANPSTYRLHTERDDGRMDLPGNYRPVLRDCGDTASAALAKIEADAP